MARLQLNGPQMQQADTCRCDTSCATDPTNSTDIVGEWGRGFTVSLPLRDIYKPTPTFLRQEVRYCFT